MGNILVRFFHILELTCECLYIIFTCILWSNFFTS